MKLLPFNDLINYYFCDLNFIAVLISPLSFQVRTFFTFLFLFSAKRSVFEAFIRFLFLLSFCVVILFAFTLFFSQYQLALLITVSYYFAIPKLQYAFPFSIMVFNNSARKTKKFTFKQLFKSSLRLFNHVQIYEHERSISISSSSLSLSGIHMEICDFPNNRSTFEQKKMKKMFLNELSFERDFPLS